MAAFKPLVPSTKRAADRTLSGAAAIKSTTITAFSRALHVPILVIQLGQAPASAERVDMALSEDRAQPRLQRTAPMKIAK